MTNDNNHDHAACVKLFTDTLARLNEINIGQMQAILDIAIAAADAANSVVPRSKSAEDFLEQVTKLIDELKAEADKRNGEMNADTTDNSKTSGFCEKIEQDINIAIQNGLANQQQLFVSGVAVLNEGAALILGSVNKS